jgi:hypothetical protein
LKYLLLITLSLLTSCFEKSIEEELKARDLNNNMVVDEVEDYLNKINNEKYRSLLMSLGKAYYLVLIREVSKENSLSLYERMEDIYHCHFYLQETNQSNYDFDKMRKIIKRLTFNNKRLLKKYNKHNSSLHGMVRNVTRSSEEHCVKALRGAIW